MKLWRQGTELANVDLDRWTVYGVVPLVAVVSLAMTGIWMGLDASIVHAHTWLFMPAQSISRMTVILICTLPLLSLLAFCYAYRRFQNRIKLLVVSTETYGKVLEENRDMIKNRMLLELLRNNRWDESPLLPLRIAPHGRYYRVISVKMDDEREMNDKREMNEQERERLLHAAIHIAEEMLGEPGFLQETALTDGRGFAMIMYKSSPSPHDAEEPELREALTELLGKLREYSKLAWTAGIGNRYDRDTMVSASYRESSIAVAKQGSHCGTGRVVYYNESVQEPPAPRSLLVGKIVDYLETRYMDEHIGLESTADRFCINPSYMGQLMKRELGLTFLQYLSGIRIGHAKQRLIGSRKSMQEIAAEVGYSNRSTFIRVFKNVVGITPSEYRNRIIRDARGAESAEG